ncbi:hypothetical protein SDC9_207818 [bioreactor metagenome]|uniref:Uncharacterized protein n=1 Tax=bioreactor metagenome TaxID=1076179 RepID=A0A645JKD0_9ZZZZ
MISSATSIAYFNFLPVVSEGPDKGNNTPIFIVSFFLLCNVELPINPIVPKINIIKATKINFLFIIASLHSINI